MDELSMVADERHRLLSALRRLRDDEWSAPSLCSGWTVKDTVAHLVAMADVRVPSVMFGMRASVFALNGAMESYAGNLRELQPAELIAVFERQIERREVHSGLRGSWLTEVVVHGLDITVPLGRPVVHEPVSMTVAADFYAGRRRRGPPWRRTSVRLVADDANWSTGVGPAVEGPLWALLLALAGRTAAYPHLRGQGVPVLATGRLDVPQR